VLVVNFCLKIMRSGLCKFPSDVDFLSKSVCQKLLKSLSSSELRFKMSGERNDEGIGRLDSS
jgi:hypothetical protein